jgi:hypothetical protein
VTCPSCGAPNVEAAQWCERCLKRFDALPPAAPALPAGAFLRTASTNLTRQFARGPLVYQEPGGELQASVLSQRLGHGEGQGLADAVLTGDSLRHLDERHTVVDGHDVPLFYVERYRATTSPSFAVYDPAGDALAVYVSDEPMIVRDGTGAPVARLRHRSDRLELLETGGDTIAQCWRSEVDLVWMVDDQWGLTVLDEPKALDRRALVAWPLVCRLLWSGAPREKRDATVHPAAGLAVELGIHALTSGLTWR